jgi:hypothetical protein
VVNRQLASRPAWREEGAASCFIRVGLDFHCLAFFCLPARYDRIWLRIFRLGEKIFFHGTAKKKTRLAIIVEEEDSLGWLVPTPKADHSR